ncbi:hypothetical protein C8Q80DRAFT_312286 [Daedaleopsis nitida]|nr:hypothetical protein C8Q80DRAFT_312286 [Daedaleopsis nitida]
MSDLPPRPLTCHPAPPEHVPLRSPLRNRVCPRSRQYSHPRTSSGTCKPSQLPITVITEQLDPPQPGTALSRSNIPIPG